MTVEIFVLLVAAFISGIVWGMTGDLRCALGWHKMRCFKTEKAGWNEETGTFHYLRTNKCTRCQKTQSFWID